MTDLLDALHGAALIAIAAALGCLIAGWWW